MALNASVSPIRLSVQQRVIVDAPVDDRLLVLAAAGTGKTHVLVERMKRLIAENDLAPGREVLALSFSRAAVRELRRRLAQDGGPGRLVRPVTFDSLATRFLASLGAEAPMNWQELGYVGRIRAAAAALTSTAGDEILVV